MDAHEVSLILTDTWPDTGRKGVAGEVLVGGLPPRERAVRLLRRLGLTPKLIKATTPFLQRPWEAQDVNLLIWWGDWVCDGVAVKQLLSASLSPNVALMVPPVTGKVSGILRARGRWLADREAALFEGENAFLEQLEDDLNEGNLQPLPQVLGESGWCLRVNSAAAAQTAETRLVRQLVKSTDGFFARHVDRKISLAITQMIAPTPLTPNAMTWITILVGLLGGRYLAHPGPQMKMLGAGLFLASSILDGCDGELARLRLEESRWGGWLDLWGDNVVHIAVFLGLGLGLTHDFHQSRWLVLSGLASFGTLCAVSIVSWRTARQKRVGPLFTSVAGGDRPHDLSPWRQRLISVSDALARRDFVYGVFVLALIQRLEWFLWASAIGANLYTLTLLFLSKKQR